jgi:hypothetical protein
MEQRSNVWVAALWMVVISLALFFLPLINGVIGGAVGGYKAGNIKRALLAALLPAVVVALGLWIVFAIFNAPLWGLAAGTTMGIIVLLADVGLFLGALIGGAVANAGRPQRTLTEP